MADPTPTSKPVNSSLPLWSKALLVAAVGIVITGVALPFVFPPSQPSTGAVSSLTSSLNAGTLSDSSSEHWTKDWSPAIFRFGFSFVIGFAIAYALRWAIKTALLVAGILALFVLGLQYFGIVDVKWGLVQNQYDDAATWISQQTKSFSAFITGALPSAASAAAGLIAGFRKTI